MSRSQAVRNEALELDGFRCQISGFDGRSEENRRQLEVHHWEPLGMGGSDELDTVANCITLHAPIHVAVETGQLVIAKWQRPHFSYDEARDPVIVLRERILEVIDNQNVLGHGIGKVDHAHLWFYRRHVVEQLEEIETRIHGLAMLDGFVAKDLYELKRDKNWRELEPNTSFSAYCASRGWNARKANSLANLYAKSLEVGIEWQEGETETDFARRLKDAGKIEPREFIHLRMPSTGKLIELINRGDLRVCRCTDDDAALMEGIGVKAGKLFRLRSEDGVLMGQDGEVIPVAKLDRDGRNTVE